MNNGKNLVNGSDAGAKAGVPASLVSVLDTCETLPRPPGIAFRILQRTRDSTATAHDVAQILAADPVLAGRIIRTANSPVYAQRGEVKSLDRAVTVLGFDTTRSTAVSFTLLKSLQASDDEGDIDPKLFWRRSLLAAIAGRHLAAGVRGPDGEEVFLASLLQDIGILALARAVPNLYDGLGAEQLHQEVLINREQERFGADHSAVGAWLAYRWQFPDEIARGILGSHHPGLVSAEAQRDSFSGCVALSSMVAEVFLDASGRRRWVELAHGAEAQLGLSAEMLLHLLQHVSRLIPESERIYEMEILSGTDAESVLEEASESFGAAAPSASSQLEQEGRVESEALES